MSSEYEAAMEIRESITSLTNMLEEHLPLLIDAIRENTLAVMAGQMHRGLRISGSGPAEETLSAAHTLLQDAHEALTRFNHEPEPLA